MFEIDSTTYTTNNYWSPENLRGLRETSHIMIHTTMGREASDIRELTEDRGRNSKSINYYVARRQKIFQIVAPELASFHCYTAPGAKRDGPFRRTLGWGNENFKTIGIEFEARENEPLTEWQISAGKWLVSYLCGRFNIPVDRNRILGHYEINVQKFDPQPSQGWNWDDFMAGVRAYSAQSDGRKYKFFPETGYSISGGFYDLWRFDIDGFPKTFEEAEAQPDGSVLTVQYFENTRMEWKPGMEARRGAVGRMYLKAIGRIN